MVDFDGFANDYLPAGMVGKVLKTRVFGKINLLLKVNSVDNVGYHPLLTVFLPVDIYDDIVLKELSCHDSSKDNNFLPFCDHIVSYSGRLTGINVFGDKDLCLRALRTFLANLVEKGIDINGRFFEVNVHKNIPVQGGMAGGSVNAAGVLCLLNEFFDLPFTVVELEQMGASLGADVPFGVRNCLSVGTGYGDNITPIFLNDFVVDQAKHYYWVLVIIREGLSTPEVFAKFDELCVPVSERGFGGSDVEALCEKIVDVLSDCDSLASFISNDLQDIAVSLRSYLGEILAFGDENGALKGFISGSGPTCVFLCKDFETAMRFKGKLEKHDVLSLKIDEVLVVKAVY